MAIVMDGNGRWAAARRRPRAVGHAAGARAARAVVERAATLGVETLTLYAFSSDNWRRSAGEVNALMRLFSRYLQAETPRCVENGISLRVVGRRDRLPARLVTAIREAEAATRTGTRMRLRVAMDYSARDAILAAARLLTRRHDVSRASFAAALGGAVNDDGPVRDVDLLVRTGAERRLSDFLLWECAYAELFFTDCLWPDFGSAELDDALRDFASRERRFGGVSLAPQSRLTRLSTSA